MLMLPLFFSRGHISCKQNGVAVVMDTNALFIPHLFDFFLNLMIFVCSVSVLSIVVKY